MRLFEGTPFDIPPKCDHCGLADTACKCTAEIKARIAPEKQTAKLTTEKRKKGKTVTVVTGLLAIANDHASLLSQLKSSCGAGGTIDGDNIEIQGEHISKVRQELSKLGYRVRP
jgi:translation initiation factor 1